MFSLKRLFLKKTLDELLSESSEEGKSSLKRSLKVKDLITMGIGICIGSGIYVTAGMAAVGVGGNPPAGPAVVISFAVVGLICILCALCYAEFAAMVPTSGSSYAYSYIVFGEYPAWIMGWNMLLEYMMASVALAISWSGYFSSLCELIGLNIPPYLLTSYFNATSEVIDSAPHILGISLVMNLPAVIITLSMIGILLKGMHQSANWNTFLVIAKLGIIFFLLVVGAFYVDPSNWTPFCPGGFAGIQGGAAFVFFAYIGFEAIATVAEETENPERNLPLGLIWSLVICTVLYISVAIVVTGMVPYTALGTAQPMATAFQMLNVNWAATVISVGALVAMTAVIFVLLLSTPRILYTMSRDGLLPERLADVHPQYRTPYFATVFNTVLMAVCAGFMDLGFMIDLCNIGCLAIFIFVCAGIIILRKTRPDLKRPFKTPFVPYVPLVAIAFCLYLAFGMPMRTWIGFLIWLVAVSVFYFAYGVKHSKLVNK
ncbi:amino acid permease [bacterium]|nr:amino acid permease [bacterium]